MRRRLIKTTATVLFFVLFAARASGQRNYIWISPQELADRPTTGEAWKRLVAAADALEQTPVRGGHNSLHDVYTMAAALVAERLDDDARRRAVVQAIRQAVERRIERDGNSLSLTRSLPGYIIAADLIDLKNFAPDVDAAFRSWLERVVYRLRLDQATQVEKHETRGNNQGTQAGVVRIAAAIYLNKPDDLQRAATVFKGWLGDSTAYRGFNWGNLCWQADPNNPVGILPRGATLFVAGALRDVDGVQPDDQRRAGCPDVVTDWPPPTDPHVWGGLQGAAAQAYLLSRQGFDAWNWQDQAVLRAVSWQHDPLRGNAPALDDEVWILPLIDQFYGTDFWDGYPVAPGKQVGWTDWTHGGEKSTQLAIRIKIRGKGRVQLDPPDRPYPPGTEVQLRALPDPGWFFAGWQGALEGLENPQTLVMNRLRQVTAVFEETAQAVMVDPSVTTSPTADKADDVAIWVHPTDRTKSLVLGVDRTGGVYVWDLQGNLLQNLPQSSRLYNIEVRQQGKLGNKVLDVAAINLRDDGKLALFKIDPEYEPGNVLVPLVGETGTYNDLQPDTYGFCLYRRPSDGALFAFDRPKRRGRLRQYRIQADASGEIRVTPVRDLNYRGGRAKGLLVDDELGFLYVADKNVGIHKFHASPERSPDRIALFAQQDGISPSREGLALYSCGNGRGYLILSSSGNSTFKIYDRAGDNRFLKTVIPRDANQNINLETEGLAATSAALPPTFPTGFLAAQDNRGNTFHLYDWADIAESDLNLCADGAPAPQPELSVSPEAYDFGEVALGDTARTAFLVMNLGTAELSVHSATLLDNETEELSLSPDTVPFTVAPGDTHLLPVTYVPTAPGTTRVRLRLLSNDLRRTPFDVWLRATGVRYQPELGVQPAQLDFGTIAAGDSALQPLHLFNRGTAELLLHELLVLPHQPRAFSLREADAPSALAPGDSLVVFVRFKPDSVAAYRAQLELRSNDPFQEVLQVPLRGNGAVFQPVIAVTPASHDFGEVNVGARANQRFTISNRGAAPLQVTALALTDPQNHFALRQPNVPFNLAPGDSASVEVTYQPRTPGATQDTLTVVSDDPERPMVQIPLVATAVVPPPRTHVFHSRADTYVRSSRPTSNFGRKPELVLRRTEAVYVAFVEFVVDSLAAPVRQATLRLFVTEDGPDGGELFHVEIPPWNETSMTWQNAPPVVVPAVAQAGSVRVGEWLEFDVTEQITAEGRYTFALRNNSSNRVKYSSKEGVHPPELVVKTGVTLPATELVQVSGNEQSGTVGTQLSEPLVVEARDRLGGPVRDVAITFEVVAGGGTLLEAQPVHTGADGRAAVHLILGNDPGVNKVVARAEGVAETLLFTATAEPLPPEVRFVPIADGYVRSTRPLARFGQAPELLVRRAASVYRSFLKFQLNNLHAPVVQARLRLYVTDRAANGGSVYSISNLLKDGSTPWDETNLSWETAPEVDDAPLAQLGTVELNTWVEVNVTQAISGDGTYSFAVVSDAEELARYASRESAHPPELVVVMQDSSRSRAKTQTQKRAEISAQPPNTSSEALPQAFELRGNYPNPFNAETTI